MTDDDLELSVAWQHHLGRSAASSQWFDTVLGCHRGAGRHYHGVRHVRWVVRQATALSDFTDDLAAVIAAAFFHDAVYDVTRSDNEAASARLADRALSDLGWTTDRRRHVASMIEATAGHDVEQADRDTRVLLAADLAVLAAEPGRYADYVRSVRREYAHVTESDWRVGRAAVLNDLLNRPHLFAPSLELHDRDRRARANITAELATLTS